MLEKPVFKPHFHIETIEGEGVFLLSEQAHKVLMGRLYEHVVPLIDGKRSADEIVDRLSGKASAAEVYYTLTILENKGYLLEGNESESSEMAAFWTVNGIEPSQAAARLRDTNISVTCFGGVALDPFVCALDSLGICTGESAAFGAVLTDDYLRDGLEAYNRKALQSKMPWMIVKPLGVEIFIGPLFVPEKTGCWMCLRDRYALNREVEQFVMAKKERKDPFPVSAAHTPASMELAFNMAATEIARWIVQGENPRVEGRMLSLDTFNWQVKSHILTRRPQCTACGEHRSSEGENTPKPIKLRPAKASFTRDGGHRTAFPEETLRKYEHLVSPITGVVNVLERDRSLGRSVHVYMAGRSFALGVESLASLDAGLRSMSAGKGMSEVQAKASGLCEAVERHSGVFQGNEPRRTARLAELGEKAIHPYKCMLYSEKQYRERESINAKKSKFNYVPEPFDDETLRIEWSPVWSLTRDTFKYLPTQYLYYRYTYPDGGLDPVLFTACSNGNASGNGLEEAILQGFLELVERDCVALWWYNMLSKPSVDLASFEEPYFEELVDYYRTLNRTVWVLDITSDLSIPAFAALSKRMDQEEEHVIFGFGCHLDARTAVQRALGEMNQSLPHVLALFGESIAKVQDFGDPEAISWWESATCGNQPYLLPDENLAVKRYDDYPKMYHDDLLKDILFCKKIIEDRGMEMLVLDQTREDIGISVAKVIVPGFRHFWARFAPGRLYDVPVQMGWLERPLKEEELNAIPFFF